MPTRADFDFGFEEIAADQDIVVPLSEAGTYYILARGQYVPGVTQDYSLAVNTIDFGITDIETSITPTMGLTILKPLYFIWKLIKILVLPTFKMEMNLSAIIL